MTLVRRKPICWLPFLLATLTPASIDCPLHTQPHVDKDITSQLQPALFLYHNIPLGAYPKSTGGAVDLRARAPSCEMM